MRVNFDVLIHLMEYLHRADLSRLMRTCKTLYPLGIKSLVANVECQHSPQSLLGCLRFMLRDPPGRAARLISLRIAVYSWRTSSLDWAQDDLLRAELANLLEQTVNLRHIDIDDTEYIFEKNGRAISALANSCVSLERLSLGIGDHVPILMHMLRTPLREITLDFSYMEGSADVFDFLRNFTGSLEELTICATDLREPDDNLCWPRVTKLHLRVVHCHDRALIHRAFPNVVEFHREEVAELEMLEHYRDENLAETEDWESLDLARIPAFDLYAMALTCPIRRLDLAEASDGLIDYEVNQLCTALRDAHPVILHICVHIDSNVENARRVWETAKTKLQVLDIRICTASSPVSPSLFTAELVPTLSCLSISYLRISVQDHLLPPQDGPEPLFVLSLREIYENLVLTAAHVVPSLRHVQLLHPFRDSYTEHEPSFWKIGRGDDGAGSPVVEQLSSYLGEAIWEEALQLKAE